MATRSAVKAATPLSISHPKIALAIGLAFVLVGASACSGDPDDPGPGTGGSGAAGTGGDPGTGGTGGDPGTGGTGGDPGTGGTGGDPGTGGTGGDPGTGGTGGDPGTGGTGGDPGEGGTGGDPGTGGTGGDPGEGGTGGDPGTGGTGGIAGEGGAGGEGGIEDPEPVVVRVEIDPGVVSISELSGSTLVATAFDAADQPIPSLPVSWRSSNPSVVSVTAFGNIFGNRIGTETITASIEGIEGEATVTVTPGVVVGVFVYGLPSVMNLGDTAYLSAAAVDAQDRTLPGRATNWTSSNPAVATVDASGVLTALAVGTSTVTAEVEGVLGTAQVEVSTPPPAVGRLALGSNHSCYLDASGLAWCWGQNNKGQLGDSTTAASAIPVPSAQALTFKRLAGSYEHTCGVTTADEIYCWGDNGYRQLGTTGVSDSTTPLLVSAGPHDMLTGMRQSNCAVDSQGNPYCWGFNSSDYELGTGPTNNSEVLLQVNPPVGEGHLELVDMQSGWFHTCGRTVDDRFFCWGYNTYGQLGVGNTNVTQAPVEVSFAGQIVEAYGVSQNATCATANGVSYCWGESTSGQLGITPRPGYRAVLTPTPISSGGTAFTAFAGGDKHMCALDDAGGAWCWGQNSQGQLGRPGPESDVPVQVSGGRTFVSIASGENHVCAEEDTGAVLCWGANGSGQLGNGFPGSFVDFPTEVQW